MNPLTPNVVYEGAERLKVIPFNSCDTINCKDLNAGIPNIFKSYKSKRKKAIRHSNVKYIPAYIKKLMPERKPNGCYRV
ncbi:hypothetical protein LCDVSa030R [Lymphocystis disease virus 3]|uniref:Uncharacterized protein n=1 Tax=Lymphocystis disease virus 3 TaxID=2560566 RepID=A0A1B2RVT2_9VIRU|nr:hypothetical protein BZK12_gp030 [Lymphocystis disease virus Sa]AOC55114.1 hypothetical protein LCDVSa030R [Lymphocystis disease virus 3]